MNTIDDRRAARRGFQAARVAMIDAALAGDDRRTRKAARRVLKAIKCARAAHDNPLQRYVSSWERWQVLAERALLCDRPAAPIAERVRQLVPRETPRDREYRGFGPEGRPIETEGGQHAA